MCKITQKLTAVLLCGMVAIFWYSGVAAQTVSKAPAVAESSKRIAVNGVNVEGVVKESATGNPIAGVNITVQGFSSAFTDDKGKFKILVPSPNAVLSVNLEGYQLKFVPVNPGEKLQIFLNESSYVTQFSEVTLPFYKGPKIAVPYSVTTVSPNGGWSANSETSDTYLQGRVTGLNVVRRSGTPGIGSNLFLRGYSSIATTNQPLVVVDGMIYETGAIGTSIISGNTDNPLGYIDPKDIDNITVIKDGGSLYGTKGANGVILISTIRAREEATKIDFAAYGGVNLKVKNIPLMGASDYRVYLSDILQDRGWSPSVIASQPYMTDMKAPDYSNYHNETNWQDEVMSNGISQNYYLKVTGGDDIATYGLSVGYIENDGLINGTGSQKYHTRFNGDLKFTSKFSGTVNLSFMNNEQNLRDGGQAYLTNPLYLASIKAPFLSTHFIDADGAVSPNPSDKDIFGIGNPLVAVDNVIGTNRNYRFLGSVSFKYAFNNNTNLSTLVGVTYSKARERIFVPEEGMAHDSLPNTAVTNRSGTNVGRSLILYNDTRLSFAKTFNHVNSLSANVGIRYSSNESESDFGYGFNSATDDLVSVGQASAAFRQIGGGLGSSRWINSYVNADYNYLNRYLLSFNMSVDGSSRFGREAPDALSLSGNKFALMPGVAFGWLLSSERFLRSEDWLDVLKLRLSYNKTGNDDIGNYSAKRYYVSQNLLGMQGLIPGNIGNPALKWETVYKANAGFDLSVWKERINVSVDFYSNRTKDMLSWRNVNTAAGLKSVLTNEGEMSTEGFELSVNSRILNRGLKWDLDIGLARYRNKVTGIPGGSMLTSFGGATFITKEGSAPNLFYGFETDGVIANTSDAEAMNLYNVLTNGMMRRFEAGDVKFVNTFDSAEDIAAGRSYINDNDRKVIGDPNPDFTGMFSNSFEWKRWSLNLLFTFSKGNDIYNGPKAALENLAGVENQTVDVLNRWRSEGQVTDVPRVSWDDPMGNSRFSDRWIEDGSYLRLRTLALSYDLPLKGKKLFKYASLYATGNNLITWSTYNGYDPEFSAGSGMFQQGVDTGLQPLFRSTQLGIRIGL